MKCTVCTKETTASETYFCYWCGRSVCTGCALRISLPFETEAVACPGYAAKSGKNEAADASMWEIVVNATLDGHDLGAWELTAREGGWQASCRTCGGTAWVGMSGLQYSLLENHCFGQGLSEPGVE